MSDQDRLQNANPQLYGRTSEREVTPDELDDDVEDKIDAREIFDILFWLRELLCGKYDAASELTFLQIVESLTPPAHLVRSITDPEHPLTLEELNVIEQSRITVDEEGNHVSIEFTPTIPHCSMATLIGLSIRVKLLRALPTRFKVDVHITPGTHQSEHAVNKQLADKERVAAALENQHLLEVVNQCLSTRN
ncbi:FAM96B [Branchiostoma lanceolatum]|uniref:Cytosolic iron-sulfur assembly component 2B n=1 Tax=Branchiostoma lanceolatum TaxID=7740 RepID=A0A8K0AAX2_BRALA|nr:FAM96B [Branchiostoma lanceolatum]